MTDPKAFETAVKFSCWVMRNFSSISYPQVCPWQNEVHLHRAHAEINPGGIQFKIHQNP